MSNCESSTGGYSTPKRDSETHPSYQLVLLKTIQLFHTFRTKMAESSVWFSNGFPMVFQWLSNSFPSCKELAHGDHFSTATRSRRSSSAPNCCGRASAGAQRVQPALLAQLVPVVLAVLMVLVVLPYWRNCSCRGCHQWPAQRYNWWAMSVANNPR